MIVGLVIVSGALLGFFSVYRQWQTADLSAGWPQTVATITSSSITLRERVGGGRRTWTVHVAYDYAVDGKRYRGSAIHLGGFPSYDSEATARDVQARYAEGTTPSVSYDPAHPDNAVLEAGAAAAARSLGLGAALLAIVLALGLTVVFQSYRRLVAARRAHLEGLAKKVSKE